VQISKQSKFFIARQPDAKADSMIGHDYDFLLKVVIIKFTRK